MPPLLLPNLIFAGMMLALSIALLAALHAQERVVSHIIAHRLGWRGVLITGWLGVPVHELAHLLFARLFRHRIIDWRLFDPDPVTGTLGYVRHAYTRRTAWQILGDFFIGIAPSLVGLTLLVLLWWWMIPDGLWAVLDDQGRRFEVLLGATLNAPSIELLWDGVKTIGSSAIELGRLAWAQRTWWLPLQLYLGVCLVAHMAPSWADLRGSWRGFIVFVVCIGLGAALLAWTGHTLAPVISFVALLIPLMAMVVLMQTVAVGVVVLVTSLG